MIRACERSSSGFRDAAVRVADETVGEIGRGLLVLVGVAEGDDEAAASRLAGKVARLRIFADETGRFDRSVVDVGGEVLVVSQFTLIADSKRQKGTRPDFSKAARPEVAEPLIERFCGGPPRARPPRRDRGLQGVHAGRPRERRAGDDRARRRPCRRSIAPDRSRGGRRCRRTGSPRVPLLRGCAAGTLLESPHHISPFGEMGREQRPFRFSQGAVSWRATRTRRSGS